jgi:protease II
MLAGDRMIIGARFHRPLRYLIEQKCNSAHLAAEGGSAGGIMSGSNT